MVEKLEDPPITEASMWTRRDPVMAKVFRYILEGWPTQTEDDLGPYFSKRLELSTQSGCIVWGRRVVIPPQGRECVLTELHSGHPGVSRMKSLAEVWWPGIDKEVEQMVKRCSSCQQNQPSPPLAPMQP